MTSEKCICTHSKDIHVPDGKCSIEGCICEQYEAFVLPKDAQLVKGLNRRRVSAFLDECAG